MALSVGSAGVRVESRPIQFASDTQEAAFGYGPHPMLMSGGWGAGKTMIGCLKGLALSEMFPRNRGVIVRYRATELRATTMATFYKWCAPHLYAPRRGGRRNDQNGYLRLADSRSEIIFMHMDDPDTAGIIRGLEINWFLWDQAEENPEKGEELFDMLMARLGRWDVCEVPLDLQLAFERDSGKPWPYRHPESGKPVPPPYAMLTCNPDVETHWLYRRFHPESPEHFQPQGVDERGEVRKSYADQGYTMFHMPSDDNRFLGKVNRDLLYARDESFIRRNVKGLWGQPEGGIHYVHPSSVLEGTPELVGWLTRTCALSRTLDHGDSAPTCCTWWAVDRNGNVFAFMEYYQPNAIVSTHRKNIAALSAGLHFDSDLADPTIFDKRPESKGGKWSVADEYSDVTTERRDTAIYWQKADNNELGTRNRINEYLRFDPERIHPITRQPGSPRLFFVKRSDAHPQGIVHGLQQIRSQRRVKIGTDLGRPIFSDERDPDITDHAYDTIRYQIASRPPAPAEVKAFREGTFQGARRLLKQAQKQARVR